jgi:hypothetical protein
VRTAINGVLTSLAKTEAKRARYKAYGCAVRRIDQLIGIVRERVSTCHVCDDRLVIGQSSEGIRRPCVLLSALYECKASGQRETIVVVASWGVDSSLGNEYEVVNRAPWRGFENSVVVGVEVLVQRTCEVGNKDVVATAILKLRVLTLNKSRTSVNRWNESWEGTAGGLVTNVRQAVGSSRTGKLDGVVDGAFVRAFVFDDYDPYVAERGASAAALDLETLEALTGVAGSGWVDVDLVDAQRSAGEGCGAGKNCQAKCFCKHIFLQAVIPSIRNVPGIRIYEPML